MTNEVSASTIETTIDSIIKSKVYGMVNLEKCTVNIEKFNIVDESININEACFERNNKSLSTLEKTTPTDMPKGRDFNHPVKCYVNKDNTISFINNSNNDPNENGEIYYACLTSAANVTQQDQILQLIPQNQLANYIVSNKEYSAVQFLNAPPKSKGNQFIKNDISDDNLNPSIVTKQNCAICNTEFPSKRSYLKHMTIHDNDREFKCRWCKLSYNHDVNLLVHVAIIHTNQCVVENDSEVNYCCLVCSLKFSRKKALQGHCLIHQIDEELYCDKCNAVFNSRKLLEKHLADHGVLINKSAKPALHCRICQLTCDSVGHMKRHYRQFHKKITEEPSSEKKVPIEDDQNFDPSSKRRRSSQIAAKIIKNYAQGQERAKRGTKSNDLSDEKSTTADDERAKRGTKSKDLSDENSTTADDEDLEPPVKRRRTNKVATKIIKRYAQAKEKLKVARERKLAQKDELENDENNEKSAEDNKKTLEKGEESTGEVRKRGRPKKIHTTSDGSPKVVNVCEICRRIFKTPILLKRHEVTHTGVKEFECPICQKKFTQKSSVKIHMAIHDGEKSFQCKHCSRTFTYEHNMFTHIRNVHKDHSDGKGSRREGGVIHRPRFMTSTPITSRYGLRAAAVVPQVIAAPLKKISSRCRQCKANKRRKCPLCHHVQTQRPSRPYKCLRCHRSFITRTVLTNHRQSHLSSKEHRCDQCPCSFSLSQTLTVHKRLHNGKRMKYKCCRCPTALSSVARYQNHRTKCHPPPPLPEEVDVLVELDCKMAPIDGIDGVSATDHKQSIHPPMPTKTYILQERSVVRFDRPFKCTQCNKSYKLRRYLRDHLKDHKSYNNRKSCHYCEKTFLTIRSLQQHTRTMHVKRRIFACTLCPATFILKASLIRHGIVHTSEKPYACPMCLKAFKTQVYCDRHINQRRCHRRTVDGLNVNGDTGEVVDGALIGVADVEGEVPYCNYRLVDADHQAAQAPNMFITDFGNEFSGDRYMVVNLDKESGGDHSGYVGTAQDQYYGQTDSGIDPSRSTELLDRYPILKATLFAIDDEDDEDCGGEDDRMAGIIYTSDLHNHTVKVDHSSDLDAATVTTNMMPPSLIGPHGQFLHGCANCPATFGDSRTLIEHVKENHNVEKDFHCPICKKSFAIELSLWAHKKIHAENIADTDQMLECMACKQHFTSVPSLSRHVRMQHNNTLNYYQCTHCMHTYKTTRELDSHIKQINADYDALIIDANMVMQSGNRDQRTVTRGTEAYRRLPREIKNPNKSRDFMVGLQESDIDHIASLDVTKTTKLSLQELIKAARHKQGLSKSTRKSRSEQDPSEASFSCAVCHKSFSRASNLHQHLSVHTGQTPFECTKCNRKFRHRCSLKTHENTKHSALMRLLRCHLCQKLLRSQVALGNHMRIHLKKYPYQCEKCHTDIVSYDDGKRHRKLKLCIVAGTETDVAPHEVIEELDEAQMDATEVVAPEITSRAAGPSEPRFKSSVGLEPMFKRSVAPETAFTSSVAPEIKLRPIMAPKAPKAVPKVIVVTKSSPQVPGPSVKAARTYLAPPMKPAIVIGPTITSRSVIVPKVISRSVVVAPPPPTVTIMEHERGIVPIATEPAPDSSASSTSSSISNVVVPKSVKCVACFVAFPSIADYESHQCRRRPAWQSHQCILCEATFLSSGDLCAHIGDCHQQPLQQPPPTPTTFSCSLCNLLFANKSLLINHQKFVHKL